MSFATLLAQFARLARLPLLRALALTLALGMPWSSVHAEGIDVSAARIVPADDGWELEAEFDIQFSQRLEEAVNRGVALHLLVEFELSRPRWYWFDEKPVKLVQSYRISYTPLLRQYRLAMGNQYQNFTRFEEVTRVLSRLRGWHVADSGALAKDQVYQAAVRMRLDTAQLPKPFQLNAIASRDWTLASEWHRWTLTP